jgi:alpha-galactosidase
MALSAGSYTTLRSIPDQEARKIAMQKLSKLVGAIFPTVLVLSLAAASFAAAVSTTATIQNSNLIVEISHHGESYTLRSKENPRVLFTARIATEVDHHWLSSSDYPNHEIKESSFSDDIGQGSQLAVTHSGTAGKPDLITIIRLRPTFAEIEVQVRNLTAVPTRVQNVRVFDATEPFVQLDGPSSSDRVLSDSLSEDRPDMEIHDLGQSSGGTHLAVGSQLIYNRQSRQSLFVGALTSEKWLTILRLHVDKTQGGITAYEADCTGTTELARQNSLRNSPKEDQIELSLPLEAGETISSERMMISLSSDYHAQLETYGDVIRTMHHARVGGPTPIGWWSWTAYYFGITEGAALTNAQFLASHLKDAGYDFFHIDEGYQFARGDYTSPVAYKFPHGVRALEDRVRGLGLTPGIWTAPFEVSQRSSVFTNHKDWLVHNAKGEPIHAGFVTQSPDTSADLDPLYVLDSTNPGAQQYLRDTYTTLTRDWGIRYIKLDFMDDSAIEGFYYRPSTTALEAQRIGLQIIREAVGDNVLLDKDGSVMLNPVGLVDTGRISCDTGHSFEASRSAAPGVAARYYMNRNFFISDADAFTISRQIVAESQNHGVLHPLTLDEAKVSIALAAISGGMYEIGDDLPTLFPDADRMALAKNRDLLNMARYAHAATPVDLMTYAPEDEMPSIFLLRESKRQSIIAIFNWTEKDRKRELKLADLGLPSRSNQALDVFASDSPIVVNANSLSLSLKPHSVQVLKIIDSSIPAAAPQVTSQIPENAQTGKAVTFSAQASADKVPALTYHWDFGDGTAADGVHVFHTFTHAANYTVHLKADGIEGLPFEKDFSIAVTGEVNTIFHPELYQRYEEKR